MNNAISSLAPNSITFGQYIVDAGEVFFRSKLCLGLVNLMPVVPGHVLIIPKRKVLRFKDLSIEEVHDLFASTQKVSQVIEREFKSTSATIAIQDGKDAGQTVFHVHVHVMPRRPGDFKRNDDVYVQLDKEDKKKRSLDEMIKEAEFLSQFFPENKDYTLD